MKKKRSHVIMFQPRFARSVENGSKPHTIRKKRKRAIRVSDRLDLREWLGKPYRSKQRKLRAAPCVDVKAIKIWLTRGFIFIRVGREQFTETQMHLLARCDGFTNASEMVDWFTQTHGLPFHGQLIKWLVI